MKNILKISAVILVSLLFLTACGTSTIYNVQKHKVATKQSSQTVYRAIRAGGQSLGWKITKIKSGLAQGTLHLRSHVAVIRIIYNNSSYSIQYVRSQNLKYNPKRGTIHKNYNGWIQNLERAIDTHL